MYSHKRRVTFSEAASDLHVDAAQIADYLQDCSFFQSESLGGGIDSLREKSYAWLLASWQIEIAKYPMPLDEITVSTWPYKFDRLFGYRNFDIKDSSGNRIAVANSYWFLVDLKTMHPTQITAEISAPYELSEKADMNYTSRKVRPSGDLTERDPFTVTRAYLDVNNHVNNAWYIRAGLEYIPEGTIVTGVRVEYVNAAVRGDRIHPFVYEAEDHVDIVFKADDGRTFANLIFTTGELQ